MSGTTNKTRETGLYPSHPQSTMSHVQRIILDFENRRLLRAEFGGYYDRPDLFSSSHPMRRFPRPALGKPCPVPEVTERDSEDVDFYEQVPDHVMYRGGEGMPRHVEREMLKRQHSLVFECNWWLDGGKMEVKEKKPSIKKKVKKFFSSLSCSSNRKVD